MINNFQPALLTDRVIAFAYDYVLIAIYLFVLSLIGFTVLNYVDSQVLADFFSDPIRADLSAFFMAVLPVAMYFTVTESSRRQASWGKAKRGLKVETTQGKRISFKKALYRSLLKLLPWQLAHTCLFHIPGWPMNPAPPPTWVIVGLIMVWILIAVYVLSVLIRPARQSVYDQLLNVQVVKS